MNGSGSFKTILCVGTMFLAWGCGIRQELPPEIPAASLEDAQRIARQAKVDCFSPEDCHPSVAMITIATPKGVSRCTGFLVSPEIMATNSHCIPHKLDRPGSDCSGRIFAAFPAMSGLPEEKLECHSIVSSTSNNAAEPSQDVAFFRLATRSQRTALRVNREGFPDRERFKVIKVNPHLEGNVPLGTMQTVACESVQHTRRLPAYDDPNSPVISLAVCEIVGGNSGAPIVDSRGEVRGIMQAVFSPTQGIEPESLLFDRSERLSMGTSFACASTPDGGAVNFPAGCNSLPGENDPAHSERWMNDVNFRLRAHANSQSAEWARRHGVGLRWIAKDLEDTRLLPQGTAVNDWNLYAMPLPECATRSAVASETAIRLPIYHYRRGYNEYLQYAFVAEDDVRLLPAWIALARQGESLVATIVARDNTGSDQTIYQREIPACN